MTDNNNEYQLFFRQNGRWIWSIAHHPNCRTFPDLAAAITALKAAETGETARVIAMKRQFRL
jgi:hypothetical protein